MKGTAGSLAFCLVLLLAASGSAQNQELRPEVRTATDLLRNLLHDLDIQPLNDFADIGDDPSDTILVALGDPAWLRQQPPGFLAEFVRRGGALLLATDHGLTDATWTAELAWLVGATVVDDPVVCPQPEWSYDGKPELPILVPPREPPAKLAGLAIRGDRKVVASLPGRIQIQARLTRPGWVQRLQGDIRPIAYLPPGSVPLRDWHRRGAFAEPLPDGQRLFGVAGPRDRGKLVLLADQHVFMNDLMVRPDLDNYEFAYATLSYLRDGPDGDRKRTRCLYLDNGQVQPSFEVPLEDLSDFPIDLLRREARKLEVAFGVMEEKGEFHKLFWRLLARQNLTPERFGVLVMVLLTLVAGLYLLYRLIASRAPIETALPRLARSLEKQVPTVRLVRQRLNEQLDEGQLHEPARHLARSMFLASGCTSGPQPPTVRIAGGWWQRWRVGAKLRRLWKLAFGTRPVPVSRRQWPGLIRDIESLRLGFLDGSIQLEGVPVA